MAGKGTYVSASGDKYQGEYVNGNKHGYGITSWTNGSRHEVCRLRVICLFMSRSSSSILRSRMCCVNFPLQSNHFFHMEWPNYLYVGDMAKRARTWEGMLHHCWHVLYRELYRGCN